MHVIRCHAMRSIAGPFPSTAFRLVHRDPGTCFMRQLAVMQLAQPSKCARRFSDNCAVLPYDTCTALDLLVV